MKRQIIIVTALAGTLDILAAFLQSYITSNVSPAIVLQYIASGILGKSAFSAGIIAICLGLAIHFFITFSCVAVYFWGYPKLKFLKVNWILNAFLIALVAWAITNLIILFISKIPTPSFVFSKSLIAISILFCCVGIPISYFARKYFENINR
jgi:hypothetical protein